MVIETGIKKIKILIVVPALECGGLERNVATICNHIDNSRFEVILAILDNSNQFFPIKNNAVTIIDLSVRNVRKSLPPILRIVKQQRPDIVLATANHLNLMLSMFRWLFPRNIKVIARESSIMSLNTQHAPMPALYNRLLKLFYRKLDHIICQSVYMQEDMTRHYNVRKEKTTVIYNAVEPPAYYPVGDHTHAQLITVGRLSKEKGIERLIRAVALLTIPFKFTVIGEGPERKALERLTASLALQDHVFFPGSSKTPFLEVPGATLFLCGSYYEGFPNAMLEATAAGIPCIAFEAPGGTNELIRPGKNGVIVEGEAAFAKAIEEAIKKNFDRMEIKQFALRNFDTTTILKQWESLFVELSDSHAS